MKTKKLLTMLLTMVMLITVSTPAFAATYLINEFDPDYVICSENFADGKINSNLLTAEGDYTFYDEGLELRAGGKLTADLKGTGKSVNEGIVNVSFSFTPSIDGCESNYVAATQKFDFGGGFVLDAQWTEYSAYLPILKDGMFMANGKELIKFNADGTGGVDAGIFRAYGEENTVPSLYYEVDAKINFSTKKINITITEKETTTSGEAESVIVDNQEFDYTADSFDYFTESFTSTDDFVPFYSYNHHLNISTEGTASYKKADGIKNVTYAEDYTFQKDSDAWITFDPKGNYTHYVDMSDRPATSGIINVSTQFWPDALHGTDTAEPASQTIEFGSGFSLNAQWSTYGSLAVRIKDGKFNVGSEVLTMNKDAWTVGEAGTLFVSGMKQNGAIGIYDISAKINLDTKKVQLKIVENLEYNGEAKTNTLTQNGDVDYLEFDYNSNVFDYYRNKLSSDSAVIRSYNRNLLIKAEGVTSYDAEVANEDVVLRKDSIDDIILQGGANTEYYVDLSDKAVVGGIVDVSFRYWPNMSSASPDLIQATQTFEIGSGFNMRALWRSYGGNAAWLYNGWIETVTPYSWKWMNSSRWKLEESGFPENAYVFRTKGSNDTYPHAYYDISAKINLDTKKINLTVVEHLETTTESQKSVLWDNVEYDYNADTFDYYKISLSTTDTYLQSLNSNLLIQADGKVSFKEKETEGLVVSDAVAVKDGAAAVTTFAEFDAAQSPYISLTFNNDTGEDFSAALVIAYYKDGVLVKLDEVREITALAQYDIIEYNYNLAKANIDADSVKVFAWSDVTGRTPLKKAAIMQ